MHLRRIVGLLGAVAISTVVACCGSAASPASVQTSTAPATAIAASISELASQAGSSQPPAAWTALDVASLTGAPVQVESLMPWAGGYVAFGEADSTSPLSGWSSQDGRSWAPISGQTFGLDTVGNSVVGGTECAGGVLVATADATGAVMLWSSSDATQWTPGISPTGGLVPALAGNSSGAIAAAGGSIFYTTDCSAWKPATLPGPATASVSGVAGFGTGYVAVGFDRGSGSGAAAAPLAWWSSDGKNWVAAALPADPGLALGAVAAGSGGLIAYGGDAGQQPGPSTFLTSADGHTWAIVTTEPLGAQGSGAETRLNGGYAGDGTHLLGYGQTTGGATEYWVSNDGSHWTKLAIGGASAGSVGGGSAQPFLMRDGVLFSGGATTAFGSATP